MLVSRSGGVALRLAKSSTPLYEAGVVKCEDVICWSDAGSCGHCGVARGLVQLSIQAYTVAGLESLAGIVPGAVVLVHFVQGTDAHLG